MHPRAVILAFGRIATSILAVAATIAFQGDSAALASGGSARKAATVPAPPGKTLKVRRAMPGRQTPGARSQDEAARTEFGPAAGDRPTEDRDPREDRLHKAGTWDGDVRDLPPAPPVRFERSEHEEPDPSPQWQSDPALRAATMEPQRSVAEINAPAPSPSVTFDGLDHDTWGAGYPPDTNGDVGPNHYIQAVNSSVGIYSKTGTRLAAFSIDTLMSQGNFGNLCDSDNRGDPVVLYDTFENRWILTDFAFQLDASLSIIDPPGAFQCFAFSKSGDPVSGGWNFYSIPVTDTLNDYPKLGVWPDGIYLSANLYGFGAGSMYVGPRVWALNKAQAYAGAPTVQVVSFDAPTSDFTLIPSNARLQTGTPPAGRPNYFVSTWSYMDSLTVYKFHVDWDKISLSTFTGPDVPLASTSWPSADVERAPSLGGNTLDTLGLRAMVQNQYSRISGVESLWLSHTVRRGDVSGFAAPRWYQVNVTGGTVAANLPQAATWDPDGANVMHRFLPSAAVNRNGDLAIGYSTSSASTKPAIKYAGRLAGDPVNTFSQTETTLVQGAGTQLTGTGALHRWGDYSAMSLDPDGCRFWYTSEYYASNGTNWRTRVGAFSFAGCTTVGEGTLRGVVTSVARGVPIQGATVTLGSRTTTTDATGAYTFAVPAGTYPSARVTSPGFITATTSSIVVPSGGSTVWNTALISAPSSSCFSDTSQAEFQKGVAAGCSLTYSAGNVALLDPDGVNQQNATVTGYGFGFTSTTWAGQTFQPSVSGTVTSVDLYLYCYQCSGTTPNLTVSIRAATGNPAVPTGPDLATATIAGFSSPGGGYFSATFASPVPVTAAGRYAIVVRAAANPSSGSYAYVCSCTGVNAADANPYANGSFVTSAASGAGWTADTTAGGRDLGFKVHMNAAFRTRGTFVSSLKDANPAPSAVPTWSTISWTASLPASTAVTFQVAASDSPDGPFVFVGSDGTSLTTFSNGASLRRFNGNRYLKYRATLTTSNPAATPLLQQVTVCFNNVVPSAPEIYSFDASNVMVNAGGPSLLSWSTSPGATLTLNGFPVSGPSGSTTVHPVIKTVYTLVASGAGTASQQVTVNVNDGAAALGTPVVTAPAAGQTLVVKGVGVNWTAVGGATGYDLRVFDNNSGAALFSGSLLGNASTSALITLDTGTYRFAVRACSGGFDAAHCGPFGLQTFSVDPAAPSEAPTVTFPAEGATLASSTQTLQWSSVAPDPSLPGLSYEVLLRNISTGSTTLQITVPSPALSTIFTMGSSTHYELKVRACQAGCGPWSTAVNFAVTLPAIPSSAPVIGSCAVSGGNSLSCNWGAVARADTYRVLVVQPSGGPGGGALTVAAVQVSATSVTLPVPAGSATVLIGACNGDGCGPNASALISASGPNPSAPNLGTPMAGTVVNGPTVLFTWNRIPTDNGSNTPYRLYVQDLSRQAAALDVYTTQNFYGAYFKAEGARYDALVIAKPGPGQIVGPASGFNVAGSSATSPTMVSPAHNSTVSSGNIQLGWSPVPGATLYEYFVAVQGQASATVRGVTTGLLAQVPLTGVGGGTVYSGVVRACPSGLVCAAGSEANWGAWSNIGGPGVTNFTVIP